MANRDDLRYVRTEASIRAAFMELVTTNHVSSVTATAICKKAGISRNAFYLHHASVGELYAALVGELVADVRVECIASAQRRASTGHDDVLDAALLDALERHEVLLRALLPSDDGSLAKRLAEGIEGAFVEAALHFGAHGGSFEHRLRCAYAAWALVGFTARWIAQSERPLTEAGVQLEELSASGTEASARYLMKGDPTSPAT